MITPPMITPPMITPRALRGLFLTGAIATLASCSALGGPFAPGPMPGQCGQGPSGPGPGSIVVRVTDGAGKAVMGQVVAYLEAARAEDRDKAGWPSASPGMASASPPPASGYVLLCSVAAPRRDGSEKTDAQGEATFGFVPAGKYRVWLGEDGGGAGARTVTVKADAATKVDFAVAAAAGGTGPNAPTLPPTSPPGAAPSAN